MNTNLMLLIADAIEQHPKSFDMDSFASLGRGRTPLLTDDRYDFNVPGVTFDIAGFAVLIAWNWAPIPFSMDIYECGRQALGLTELQADRLFYFDDNSTVWVRHADEYGYDLWLNTGVSDWLDSDVRIPASDAAHMLRRIAYGEVTL